MSTTTKKYQIIQKLENGNTLVLHPETEASVISANVNEYATTNLETILNGMVNSINETDNSMRTFYVRKVQIGAENGVASLDANGRVPSSQLPSYVDDVLEYNAKSAFPATGESGKIYVDKTTNLTWRWSGSTYVEISPTLALGETSSTAYAGNKGKANRDDINAILNGTKVVAYAYNAQTALSMSKIVRMQIMSDTLNEPEIELDLSEDGETNCGFTLNLVESGVTAGTYSCVSVDKYGRATAGAQIIEVGTSGQTTPSNSLAVGGLFFKEI